MVDSLGPVFNKKPQNSIFEPEKLMNDDYENKGGNLRNQNDFQLLWKNLNISVKKTGKQIIDGLSGAFESGKLIAVIGASGCGKTTFLNYIAGYTRDDLEVSGGLFINDVPLTNLKKHKQITGYVLQQDILLGELTVFETLMYQAKFKLPAGTDYEEAVNNVIDLMKLEKCKDS